MSDVLFLATAVLVFCIALLSLAGLSYFVIREYLSDRAKRRIEQAARVKRERTKLVSDFMNLLREVMDTETGRVR